MRGRFIRRKRCCSDVFHTPEEVLQALKNAESGEHFHTQFFIRTVLDDLRATEKKEGKSCRMVLVLDESGQWIEDDKGGWDSSRH